MAGEAMSAFVRFFVRDEVSGDAARVEQAARQAADGMDEAADVSGNKLTRGLKSAGGMAVTAAKGLAGVGAAVGGAVAGIMAFTGAASESLEDMGKLETAFTTAGHSAETAQGVYSDFVGILGETDQAVEASNHLAELTNSQKDLNKWGTIAAGVYARFGDSLPLEGLTEAANETAKVGTVTGPLADALNWAGIKEDEFNQKLAACNTEQERAALITETLNGEYAEAGNKYLELNEKLVANREAQANWNNAMGKAGEAVMPVSTALMDLGASIMEKAMPYLQQFAGWFTEKLPAAQDKVMGFVDAVWPTFQALFDGLTAAKDAVFPAVSDGFQWFADNLPAIVSAVTGLFTAFMAYHGLSAIVGAISAIKTAYMALEGATMLAKIQQLLLNTAMKMNPFVLIVSLIAGLVVAFITAYTTSETFRNKVNAVFNKVKGVISGAMNTAKSVVTGAMGAIKGVISGASGVINGLGAKFQAVKAKIAGAINGARDAVRNAINRIKGILSGTLKFPNIKLPHFNIKGGQVPWGIGGKGTPPKISIDWYKDGALFSKPTLFATPYGMKGVGEAGPEFVSPVNVLKDYVREAVTEANRGGYVSNVTVNLDESGRARDIANAIKRAEKRNAYALGIV